MGRAGGYSDGRDIGAVFNYPNPGGAHALADVRRGRRAICPGGGLGAGDHLQGRGAEAKGPADAIALVLGGDASCATGGFWAALTIATTQSLPMLFYVEDNGYGISVPSYYQTPGGDIAANLASFSGLTIFSGDGTEPAEAARLIDAGRRACPRPQGPGAAPADRAAARGPQLPGHADLQERESSRRRMGARSAAEARSALRGAGDQRLAARSARRSRPRSKRRAPKPKRAPVSLPEDVTRHVFFEGELQGIGGRAGLDVRDHRPARARGPADQHGHRDPPGARPGTRRQSAGAGVRRGCRAQGRGPCGDARPAGQIWRRRGCSTRRSTRKGSSAARSAWRWPG